MIDHRKLAQKVEQHSMKKGVNRSSEKKMLNTWKV